MNGDKEGEHLKGVVLKGLRAQKERKSIHIQQRTGRDVRMIYIGMGNYQNMQLYNCKLA